MPLTIAHIAAVLPVRRLPIVLSAFVVGTMAPDFEYFVRLAPQSRWSHHVPGIFIFTLPCALLVLWLYHKLVKNAAITLLPQAIQRRLPEEIERFSFGGIRRFVEIVLSILGGIATHILWDLFTHFDTPIYRTWGFMQQSFGIPVIGDLAGFKVLQLGSTIFGILALIIWVAFWLRSTAPVRAPGQLPRNSGPRKLGLVSLMLTITALAAIARGYEYTGVPDTRGAFVMFVGVGFATAVSALWLQMLIYAVLWGRRHRAAELTVE